MNALQEQSKARLDHHRRKPAQLTDLLNSYASHVAALGSPEQHGLFGGDVANVTRREVWQATIIDFESKNAVKDAQRAALTGGSDSLGLFDEAPQQPASTQDQGSVRAADEAARAGNPQADRGDARAAAADRDSDRGGLSIEPATDVYWRLKDRFSREPVNRTADQRFTSQK